MTLSQRLKLNSSFSNNSQDPWCRRSSVILRKANNGPCRRGPCPSPRATSFLITPGSVPSSLPHEWPPHDPSQCPQIPVNSCWGLIRLRLHQSRMCTSQPEVVPCPLIHGHRLVRLPSLSPALPPHHTPALRIPILIIWAWQAMRTPFLRHPISVVGLLDRAGGLRPRIGEKPVKVVIIIITRITIVMVISVLVLPDGPSWVVVGPLVFEPFQSRAEISLYTEYIEKMMSLSYHLTSLNKGYLSVILQRKIMMIQSLTHLRYPCPFMMLIR